MEKINHLNLRKIRYFLVLLPVFICVYAQAQPQVTVKLLSEEKLTLPEQAVKPLLIRKDQQIVRGYILLSAGKMKLSLPDRPALEFPYSLETLVSLDGKTILQFGDELDKSHPQRTNLYWVDNSGNIVSQVVNYYAERARISLSDNGFTAVAGPLYQERDTVVLSLYAPTGEKLWEFALNKNQRAANVKVTPKGEYTILVTTDNKEWLKNHQLHIVNDKGELQASLTNFDVIQKITLVDNDEHLFVQGYDTYGLVKIPNGSIVWLQREKIRMVSPFAAQISPQGDLLFIILADFQGKPQATYRWQLVSLNVSDGKEVHSAWLPKEYPSTWHHVFEQISSNRLQILAGQERIIYSWQKQKGGN